MTTTGNTDFLVRIIEGAEDEVRMLADEPVPADATPRERARGDQMHRRAAAGRALQVHVHGRDIWGGQVALSDGTVEATGSTKVTLRLDGQSLDKGQPIFCATTAEARAVCDALNEILRNRPEPIPAPL
jgi:hypothetical protein